MLCNKKNVVTLHSYMLFTGKMRTIFKKQNLPCKIKPMKGRIVGIPLFHKLL
jgi:hypothetical protein